MKFSANPGAIHGISYAKSNGSRWIAIITFSFDELRTNSG